LGDIPGTQDDSRRGQPQVGQGIAVRVEGGRAVEGHQGQFLHKLVGTRIGHRGHVFGQGIADSGDKKVKEGEIPAGSIGHQQTVTTRHEPAAPREPGFVLQLHGHPRRNDQPIQKYVNGSVAWNPVNARGTPVHHIEIGKHVRFRGAESRGQSIGDPGGSVFRGDFQVKISCRGDIVELAVGIHESHGDGVVVAVKDNHRSAWRHGDLAEKGRQACPQFKS